MPDQSADQNHQEGKHRRRVNFSSVAKADTSQEDSQYVPGEDEAAAHDSAHANGNGATRAQSQNGSNGRSHLPRQQIAHGRGRRWLADRHREILKASAITEERVRLWTTVSSVDQVPEEIRCRWGKKAVPGMLTTWITVSGQQVPQIRVDNPIKTEKGKDIRYLFPEDSGGIVGTDAAFERDWANVAIPLLLVEGTKQSQAAASTIPAAAPFAIPFGLAGCWGWSKEFKPSADLLALPVEGRDVLVAFDADIASNWGVWEAARRLANYLIQELMARSVRFLLNPGAGGDKDGLDDLLGRHESQERRVLVLRNLIDKAVEHKAIKAPRRPSKGSEFFDGNNFKPYDLLEFLRAEHDLAMSGDMSVAVYHQGVYWNGQSLWWSRLVSRTLGNDYRPEFEANVTRMALAFLKTESLVIPFQQKDPIINFRNCLLDARTLEKLPHTPEHLSLVQFPIDWDPKAECPRFLKWIEEVAPGQLEALLDVLSQMLDLSEWPRVIVFLVGPTRSGKSTMLRITQALVGVALRSSVSLHDLTRADDKFASSSLFGKVLNTYADLSANDLQDLALVKGLTGGDEFEAQRKGRDRFVMMNQAMLLFSANSVPAVSDDEGAYLGRVAPFRFPHSFAGNEDPSIEDWIIQHELPGVMRLLVEALHKRKQRGNFLPRDPERQRWFANQSDRVRMFLAEKTVPGDKSSDCITKADLYPAFVSWLEEEHGGRKLVVLGKQRFNSRVRLVAGEEFAPKGSPRRWNLLWRGDETGDDQASETGDEGPGDGDAGCGGGSRGQGDPASPVSGPKTGDQQGDPQIPGGEEDLELPGGEASPESPVCSYPPTSQNELSQNTKTLRWVKTGETADALPADLAAELAAPGSCARPAHGEGSPADPAKPQQGSLPLGDLLEKQVDGPAPKRKRAGRRKELTGEELERLEQAVGELVLENLYERIGWDGWAPLEKALAEEYGTTIKRVQELRRQAQQNPQLPTETELGPLPIERLAPAGDTGPLVMDLETRSADQLWTTPSDPTEGFIRLAGTQHGVSAAPALLVAHQGVLVAHNGFGFDFLALARHHGFDLLAAAEEGRLLDTMVAALALDPPVEDRHTGKLTGGRVAKLFRLDALAEKYGVPGKTDDLARLAEAYGRQAGAEDPVAAGYGLIPRNHPDFVSYLRGDVAATDAVLQKLCPGGEIPQYVRREMRVMGRLVTGITLHGFRLDEELTRDRYSEIEARKEGCRQRLVKDYGLPVFTSTGTVAANPLNCNGAAEAILKAAADVGLELPRTEKTGKPSTSKDNLGPLLEKAREEGHQDRVDLLETILALTGARTVYGTALAHLQPDGCVHPSVSPLQASGRISVTNPGLTVFGKRGGRVIERAIFLPDSPDHRLLAADLSQIDMRAMAAHAQDPAYLQLFEPGRDAHSEVAAAVGLSRSDAKAIGHGWNYGMSVNGMVAHGIDRALAEQFDQGMRRAFPALVRWRDQIRRRAERGLRLDNGFGRMMRPNPERAHTQAPALMGQGTARDLMMVAILRLPLWLVPQLRAVVHDEIVFSVPADRVDEAGRQILEAMSFEWAPPGARLLVKVCGDLSRPGRNWADCYRGES